MSWSQVYSLGLRDVFDAPTEPFGTGADGAFHAVFSVHFHQPELRPPAVFPFKVVQQTPVEIAAQVHALADGPFHSYDSFLYPPAAVFVLTVRYAVFGYKNRFFEPHPSAK